MIAAGRYGSPSGWSRAPSGAFPDTADGSLRRDRNSNAGVNLACLPRRLIDAFSGQPRTQEGAKDWVIDDPLPLPPPRFLFAQFIDFAQKFLLDVPLHLNTIKILWLLHNVTTSRGE
jgi:hypothetical protein